MQNDWLENSKNEVIMKNTLLRGLKRKLYNEYIMLVLTHGVKYKN